MVKVPSYSLKTTIVAKLVVAFNKTDDTVARVFPAENPFIAIGRYPSFAMFIFRVYGALALILTGDEVMVKALYNESIMDNLEFSADN